jgi:hypothetical protein
MGAGIRGSPDHQGHHIFLTCRKLSLYTIVSGMCVLARDSAA